MKTNIKYANILFHLKDNNLTLVFIQILKHESREILVKEKREKAKSSLSFSLSLSLSLSIYIYIYITHKSHLILNIYTYVPLVESDEYIKKPTPTIKLIHSQKVFEIYIQYPKVKILVQWHEKIKKCILLSKYKTGKNDLKSDHFGALEVNPKQTKKK